MKHAVLFGIAAIFVQSCGVKCFCENSIGNMSNRTIQKLSIEKFDVKKYKELEIKRKDSFKDRANVNVKFDKDTELYYESRSKEDDNFTSVKSYDIETGNIRASACRFQDFPVGKYLEFDEDGTVVKTIDHEERHPFSLEDLRKLIRSKYEVDIYKKSSLVRVTRPGNGQEYSVAIPISDNKFGDYRILIVHSTTGEITEESVKHLMQIDSSL